MAMSANQAARYAQMVSHHLNKKGLDTYVNGKGPIDGVWYNAEPVRVQTYVQEEEWKQSVWDVVFPVAVLSSPYNLADGSRVYRVDLNQYGVVRRVDPEGPGGDGAGVIALVVLTQRE